MGKLHPFGGSAVPIVGQPYEILGWTLVAMVRCKCAGQGVVPLVHTQTATGAGAGAVTCPGCRRPLVLRGVSGTPAGELQLTIDYGQAPIEGGNGQPPMREFSTPRDDG